MLLQRPWAGFLSVVRVRPQIKLQNLTYMKFKSTKTSASEFFRKVKPNAKRTRSEAGCDLYLPKTSKSTLLEVTNEPQAVDKKKDSHEAVCARRAYDRGDGTITRSLSA